jgi:indolepyruvate ferredoxin oxidoreductase, alpha subunit
MSRRPKDPLLVDVEGHAECLLGNEAIVRGALEAGLAFASGYPGTPSSEISDSFARLAGSAKLVFEYSINEKIALETAFGASLAGARAMCAMKHLGLMYAGDPLSTIPYIGPVGGLVIVSAGDPSCRTSPNEQDQRLLAPMLHIPVLDPSTPEEAYRMAIFAFDLSEQSRLPVLLRPTTRVCHSRAVIRYGRLRSPVVTGFVRDPLRFVPIPANARRLRIELGKKVETARRLIESSAFVSATGGGELAILASGAPAATCADLLEELNLTDKLRLVTLGAVYPLPEEKLLALLDGVRRVLVVEELSPFVEDALGALLKHRGLSLELLGKRSGHLPVEFEYTPEIIQRAIQTGLGLGREVPKQPSFQLAPARPPSLCPGCPHRPAQFALRAVFGDEGLYFNDIGCYTLGYGPPLNTADALLSMGAAFTLAAGVARVTGRRTVGIMGDSTFFHSGMPALLEAVRQDADIVAVVLDNHVTGMTGFQESPTVERIGDEFRRNVTISSVAKVLGASHVETVDPYDLPATIAAFERARAAQGVSVVVCERTCPVHLARETKAPRPTTVYQVDPLRCRICSREECGMRCGQEVDLGFESFMARGRVLEIDKSAGNLPGQAPCSLSCPLGLCIQGYIGHIASGNYQAALEEIVRRVPLPESVCRVCHRPCEAACVRTAVDEPLAVNDLKRFVVDWAAKNMPAYDPERDDPCGMRVAIVGAGPSGLAAAHDLCLRGYAVTLYDAEEKPGGILRYGIPGYRLPGQALDRDIDRIINLGVRFEGNRRMGRDFSCASLLEQGFQAVYLALGAGHGLPLEIEGAGAAGNPEMVDALDFLRQIESRSVPSRVVVVGGGNAAMDAARSARRLGAGKVVVAYRRDRDEMPAIADEIDASLSEGVELATRLVPVRLEPGRLVCLRTEPGETDASGRRRPVPIEGSEIELPADLVIAAIGQRPEFEEPGFDQTPGGLVQVENIFLQTSNERVFAGGDLVPGERTVTSAVACGQRAGWAIDRRLRGEQIADRRPPPPPPGDGRRWTRPGIDRADHLPRVRPEELAGEKRLEGFDEVVSVLSEGQARAEASRCLSCGTCGNCRACLDLFGCPAFFEKDGLAAIDPGLCNGCGVCAELCPNGAIHSVVAPGMEPGS